MKKEMRIKSLKTLLVLCMTLALLLVGTACSGNNNDVDEEEGLEEYPGIEEDVVEDDFYQKIDPYNDGPITLIDTEDVSVRDVEPGTILGQFDAGDYQIQLSKPQLPDELLIEVERYNYQWIMVNQIGGLAETFYPSEEGGYSLIIFFPDYLVITAYPDDEGYHGWSISNFGYTPTPGDEDGRNITFTAFKGEDINPTDKISAEDFDWKCDDSSIQDIVEIMQSN